MALHVDRVELPEIERLRDIYRHEMNCQVIHDSIHGRPGWTHEYLISAGGAKAGYPRDREPIGDKFLWMRRSAKGPNTFSQTVKDLQPGRLYSLKMFTCDYRDLTDPRKKELHEANRFIGSVVLEGVVVDAKRSFMETYASNPEPKIPVWITYHWKVFKALGPTARLIVSDWPGEKDPAATFGQEQAFNFVEVQPYRE